jgi:molybdopterin converting factor small subunit
MLSPLERFLREYVEAAGGLYEEIEPQVYDVLWPDADEPLRLTLDPDALPEHPSAQLLAFGNPLLDRLLEEARARGRIALAYLTDVHLMPHALDERVRRDLTLPAGAILQVDTVRPVYATHTLFWFEATFLSDEREQALYSAAVDRYYGRPSRHLEPLLEGEHLSETRPWLYPDATSLGIWRAYLLARERVVRTATTEARGRKQEMESRLAKQMERMVRYFADLREELQDSLEKAQSREDKTEHLISRLNALAREEALRLEEMRRKAMLRVHLKLMNLLHLKVPRLFLRARLIPAKGKDVARNAPATAVPLSLTWDPLLEKTDAIDCSGCGHPTYALAWAPRGGLLCPACAASDNPSRGR